MSSHTRPGVGPDFLVAGRYRLRGKIGGTASAVWRAHDRVLDRDVAVKQVHSVGPAGVSQLNAAITEGRLAAQLTHPHAIAMYDVAIESGDPWLVMEYLPSISIAQALALDDRLPAFEVAQFGAQVADALVHAHAVGVIHRDIKPGNLLVADRDAALGIAKITDFGIARATSETDTDLGQRTGLVLGTPAYLAPEVARGHASTTASDVFSLGATLYTAVEGQPPFGTDPDDEALLMRVARGKITPPTVADEFSDVLLHMLAPDPSKRVSMSDARDLLAQYVYTHSPFHTRIYREPIRSLNGTIPAWAQRNPVYVPAPSIRAVPAPPRSEPARPPRPNKKLRNAFKRWSSDAAS